MADERARKLADKGSTPFQRSHTSADTHLHYASEHFSNYCSPAPTRLDTAGLVGSARYTAAEEAQYLEATSGHTADVCDDSGLK